MNYIDELTKKDNIKRRILLAVILVVTFLLQTTSGFFPAPFGIHACLLIPATVCIAMFEREFAGLFFGLAAGMMLETVSPDSAQRAVTAGKASISPHSAPHRAAAIREMCIFALLFSGQFGDIPV